MSTSQYEKPDEDPNLIPRELVYVAVFIIIGVIFAMMVLTGSIFFS